MGIRTFELTPDQRQYFTDVDNSILHNSVEIGRILLQEESLKSTLSTLYSARMKQMHTLMEVAGLNVQDCLSARVENGSIIVQIPDSSPPSVIQVPDSPT